MDRGKHGTLQMLPVMALAEKVQILQSLSRAAFVSIRAICGFFSALPGWVSFLIHAIDSRQKEDFENGKT